MLQSSWDRSGKQQQKQNSPNLGPALYWSPVERIEKRVLHANVGQPHFVHHLSMSRTCPIYVQLLPSSCPTYVLVHLLSRFCLTNPTIVQLISSFCPQGQTQIQICPNLVQVFGWESPKNCWTVSGQLLEWLIFTFTTWLPCRWTETGQILDISFWTNLRQIWD